MGDHAPPPPPRSNLTMLYYGLVVVGIATILLLLYNLLILKWCSEFTEYRRRQGPTELRVHNPNTSFTSGFKYKSGGVAEDLECSVCLSVFEEGEEVRQLPRCKHCFHASCIDMWLHSHLDCPLCRSPVDPPVLRHPPVDPPILWRHEHTREVFLGPAVFV